MECPWFLCPECHAIGQVFPRQNMLAPGTVNAVHTWYCHLHGKTCDFKLESLLAEESSEVQVWLAECTAMLYEELECAEAYCDA